MIASSYRVNGGADTAASPVLRVKQSSSVARVNKKVDAWLRNDKMDVQRSADNSLSKQQYASTNASMQ